MKQMLKAILPYEVRNFLNHPIAFTSLRVREFLDRHLYSFHYLAHLAGDCADVLLRRRKPLTPPRRYTYLIGGNFEQVGQRFLQSLIEKVGLRPTDHVLDAGCGIGRMALPLAGYLSSAGRYEGFDSWPSGVRWCQTHITPRFPHFQFQLAAVHNGLYSNGTRARAAEYRFPYADASFDVVFMTSVLTHLLPDDMENYLAETARVLKPGGQCLITWFLLDAAVLAEVSRRATTPSFPNDHGRYRTESRANQEGAIGYDRAVICDVYERLNLEITAPIEAGAWSGAVNPVNFQDVIVARKKVIVSATPLAA